MDAKIEPCTQAHAFSHFSHHSHNAQRLQEPLRETAKTACLNLHTALQQLTRQKYKTAAVSLDLLINMLSIVQAEMPHVNSATSDDTWPDLSQIRFPA